MFAAHNISEGILQKEAATIDTKRESAEEAQEPEKSSRGEDERSPGIEGGNNSTNEKEMEDTDGSQETRGEREKDTCKEGASTALGKGDNVLARHGGGCNWYPGTILGANDDGTYDIRYEDGDSEQGVLRYRIKLEGQEERPELQERDVVDARHNGGKRAYPGEIQSVGKNDTYDILYADGDSEKGLQRDFIYGLCEKLPPGVAAANASRKAKAASASQDQEVSTETTAIESLEEISFDLT